MLHGLLQLIAEAETEVHQRTFPHNGERRAVERIVTHWPLRIAGGQEHWVDTSTQNLSSRGFYCISPAAMQAGQEIDCRLSVPDPASRQCAWIHLLCRARVTRVELLQDGYGLGCQIQDYIVLGSDGSDRVLDAQDGQIMLLHNLNLGNERHDFAPGPARVLPHE